MSCQQGDSSGKKYDQSYFVHMTMLSPAFWGLCFALLLFWFSCLGFTSSMDIYWTVYGSMLSFDTPNEEA